MSHFFIGCREKPKILVMILVLCNLAIQSFHAQTVDDIYAIKAGTIVTVTQGVIENGIILIKEGLIEAVGTDVEIPVEAEIIHADSLFVYPGFIDGHTSLALKKPKTPELKQKL